jgi:hypothetical protein
MWSGCVSHDEASNTGTQFHILPEKPTYHNTLCDGIQNLGMLCDNTASAVLIIVIIANM